MIIQALAGYYDTLFEKGEVPALGWSVERVHYALRISQTGELTAVAPLSRVETFGKKEREVPRRMNVPERVVRSSGIAPNFLCENAAYFFGVSPDKPKRAQECFLACKELHLKLLAEADGPAAQAIKAFFNSWSPEQAAQHPEIAPLLEALYKSNMVFMVDGCFAHENEELRHAWNAYALSAGTETVRCLVSGRQEPFERLHARIKLPGAQSSGASLVSYNSYAYESYGKEQNMNAAIGKQAAFAYTTALNHLIADTRHRQAVGRDTLLYWSEDASPEPQEVLDFMVFPKADENEMLAEIMQRLAQGLFLENVNMETPFYILCLSPNAARISVRYFLRDSFGNILKNCLLHYRQLAIEKPPYEREYLSPYWMLMETVNPKSSDKTFSPQLAAKVMNSIFTGAPYPTMLYQAVFLRIKADREINRGRAAVIKAYLLRNTKNKYKEELTMSLNTESTNAAYTLGRLFAVLENLQEKANGTANIKERYFTSACATPANVFPILLKLANHHAAKLEDRRKIYFNKEIGALLEKIAVDENARSAFPKHLNMDQQGLFVLGYYHQVQNRFNGKNKEEENDGTN